jgi:hypothetical protein
MKAKGNKAATKEPSHYDMPPFFSVCTAPYIHCFEMHWFEKLSKSACLSTAFDNRANACSRSSRYRQIGIQSLLKCMGFKNAEIFRIGLARNRLKQLSQSNPL